ncbi:redoxin family protein [Candidatus Micrarchaeota archaeon]|nr:redoxin family protein [Candidatus Micrarchaeota archaeon]
MDKKTILLIIALVLIGGVIFYFESTKVTPSVSSQEEVGFIDRHVDAIPIAEKQRKYERGIDLSTPDGWINTNGVSVNDLVGKKVVLIDFWTYSCINCQRTTPYLNAWYEKYADSGLEIIGVHTPEFDFEKDYDNVKKAVEKFGIKYPVALDNDYSTWREYGNRYWPRKYLIDIDGYIVYDHIGEGGYEETEAKIQELLAERKQKLNEDVSISSGMVNPSVEAPSNVASPETYFGADRNELLANGLQGLVGKQSFSEPSALKDNSLYLVGDWHFEPEYAESITDGKVLFNYQAKNVYFVASADQETSVGVYLDGELLKTISVKDSQLYELVQGNEVGKHSLELRVRKGLKAFTFTFG